MRIILASPEAKVWSVRKHIPLGWAIWQPSCVKAATK